jgi:hypothetical protein
VLHHSRKDPYHDESRGPRSCQVPHGVNGRGGPAKAGRVCRLYEGSPIIRRSIASRTAAGPQRGRRAGGRRHPRRGAVGRPWRSKWSRLASRRIQRWIRRREENSTVERQSSVTPVGSRGSATPSAMSFWSYRRPNRREPPDALAAPKVPGARQ